MSDKNNYPYSDEFPLNLPEEDTRGSITQGKGEPKSLGAELTQMMRSGDSRVGDFLALIEEVIGWKPEDIERRQRSNDYIKAKLMPNRYSVPESYEDDYEETQKEAFGGMVPAVGMAGKEGKGIGRKIGEFLGIKKPQREASNFERGIKSAPVEKKIVDEKQDVRAFNRDATDTYHNDMQERIKATNEKLMKAGSEQEQLDDRLEEMNKLPPVDVDRLLEIARELAKRRNK